jgi:transposase
LSAQGAQIQRQSARRQTISSDLQDRIIQYLHSNTNVSIAAAARTFGVAASTANGIMRRFEARGTTTLLPKGGSRRIKMTHEATLSLSSWLDERPDITLCTLKEKLRTEQGIVVSVKTIATHLIKNGFTVKILRTMPISRNCPETVQARYEYAQKYINDAPADHKNIIWVDECGFNLHIRRKCGRSRRGERASMAVANGRGRNISVCAAMSEEGFLLERLRLGSYNAEEFCAFLRELFTLLGQMGRDGCWIILDNVRFHHSPMVSLCATSYGHHLIFLPAYSPMLNPIESLFGKWKTLIRTQSVSMSQDSLLSSMATARVEITVPDCLGWIRDMTRNLALSLQYHLFN